MLRTVQRQGFHHSNSPRRPSQVKLQLNPSTELSRFSLHSFAGLPQLSGRPIHIRFESQLTAYRGKLLCDQAHRGNAVYAASFIRKREVVVDSELVKRPRVLRLILIHELFHFVWMRLGNRARVEFSKLLANEYKHRSRGELGESAAVKKSLVEHSDCRASSRRWRDYVCESFCDTAAWRYSGMKQIGPFTLASRWRKRREVWFNAKFAGCTNC